MKAENILLIGFMGTGKSTVSKELSKRLPFHEMDTDEEIVSREGMSIPEIFERYGEAYFRDCETKLLEALKGETGWIISCGGGMALREENRIKMQEAGTVILLRAKPETILKRVINDNNRPLLRGRKSVEGISELLNQRMDKYNAAADIIVDTDGKTPAKLAEEIVKNCKYN